MPATGRFPRVGHVTPFQNERLRLAMLAYRDEHCGGSTSRLAKLLKRSQPALSTFLNKKTGASYVTADRFAEKLGRPVNEILGPAGPVAGEVFESETTCPDVAIGTFLLKLRERPGLYDAIMNEPGRWRVTTVVRATEDPGPARADGVPVNGWRTRLDAIESASPPATTVAPSSAPERSIIPGDVHGDSLRQMASKGTQVRKRRR